MAAVTTAKARDNFSDVVHRAGQEKERVVLTDDRGRRVAAVVPIEDLGLLEEMERVEDQADLEAARKALREGGPSIPWEEAKRMLAKNRSLD